MASQPQSFQFINTSGPSITERRTNYLVRSHAAIWAHSGRKLRRKRKLIDPSDIPEASCICLSDIIVGSVPNGQVADRDCDACSGNAVLSSSTAMVLSEPSPVSLLAAGRQDPFDSLALSCTPLESYMVDHYVKFLLPQFNIYSPEERSYSVFVQCMITRWVPFAFTDPGMMYGLLMLSCRSLAAVSKSVIFDQKALLYKSRCIKSIKEALKSDERSISDSTIWNVLSLASDEFHNGSLDAAKSHTKAIRDMVKMRGGLKALGIDGLLQQLVVWNDGTASFYTGKELTLTQDIPQTTVPFAGYLTPGFKDHMSLFSPNMLSILSNCYITANLTHHTDSLELVDRDSTTPSTQSITSRLLALSSTENSSSSEEQASSQMEECLSLALLIYIKCYFPPKSTITPRIPPLADLASRIRYLLAGAMRVGSWGAAMSLPERRTRGIWDLQLWMTFMAAMGISQSSAPATAEEGVVVVGAEQAGALRTSEEDMRWAVNTASALVKTLGIESRGDMEACLGTFLEVGGALKVFSGEFWMAVSVLGSAVVGV